MFEKELSAIKNPVILRIVRDGVALIPDYFYRVPASSSGKYHPAYAVGDGGLYRHVKAAVAIAIMLFKIHNFSGDEEDLIVGSLILHDGWKQGLDGCDGHTLHGHPIIARDVLLKNVKTEGQLELEYLYSICDNVASHMGQWNTSNYDTLILPLPVTPMQKYVHMCDYLASRKPLEFNFSV